MAGAAAFRVSASFAASVATRLATTTISGSCAAAKYVADSRFARTTTSGSWASVALALVFQERPARAFGHEHAATFPRG